MIIRDKFCQFCIKTYVVTPHLHRDGSDEESQCVVSMRYKKQYHQKFPLISSFAGENLISKPQVETLCQSFQDHNAFILDV